MSERNAQDEADKLRAEAKLRLHEQFCIMGRNDREAVSRIVDCIIGAAVLELAAMQEHVLKDLQ